MAPKMVQIQVNVNSSNKLTIRYSATFCFFMFLSCFNINSQTLGCLFAPL